MHDEEREHVVVLTDAVIGEPSLIGAAGRAVDALEVDEPTRRLVECALAGDVLRDRCPDVDQAAIRRAARFVQAVRCPGRFWYAWVLVDLGDSQRPWHGGGARAITIVNPRGRGLVLAWDEGYPEGSNAEVVTARSQGLTSPLAFLQYVRAILRTMPPSRVLLTPGANGVALGNDLGRHDVALLVDTHPAAGPARRRRRSWLDTLGGLAVADGSSATSAAEVPQRLVARAAAVFVPPPDRDLRLAVRTLRARGLVLPWTAEAVGAWLSDWNGVGRLLQPPTDQVRLSAFERSDRSPGTAPRRVLYACMHLLGDALNATPILRQHRREHPDDHLTFLVPDESYARIFELSRDVDRVVYADTGGRHDLLFGSTRVFLDAIGYAQHFDEHHVLDIHEVASDEQVRGRSLHMADGYAHRLGRRLDSRRPSLDTEEARRHCPPTRPPGRYVVLSRHSVSGRRGPDHEVTKRWAESRWRSLAARIRRELGLAVVSIGTPGERPLQAPGVVDMHDLSILEVAGLLAEAALLVSIDNGVYHVSQAVGCPVVHIVPAWLGARWTERCPEVTGRDLVGSLQALSVAAVLGAAKDVLDEGAASARD